MGARGVCMAGRAVDVDGDDSSSRILGQKANILVDLGFSVVPSDMLEIKIFDPLLLSEACAILEKLLEQPAIPAFRAALL